METTDEHSHGSSSSSHGSHSCAHDSMMHTPLRSDLKTPSPREIELTKSYSKQDPLTPHIPCHGFTSQSELEEIANQKAKLQLYAAGLLCFLFMIAEVFGGIYANSLAVLTDAAHLLSDLFGFCISIFALHMASRSSTHDRSFGYHRAEIIGAFCSVLLIWVLTVMLLIEAIERIQDPQPIDGKIMFIIASAGLGVNIAMGFILHQAGHGHSHGELVGAHGGSCGHGHAHHTDSQQQHQHGHSHADQDSKHSHNHGHHDDDDNQEGTYSRQLMGSPRLTPRISRLSGLTRLSGLSDDEAADDRYRTIPNDMHTLNINSSEHDDHVSSAPAAYTNINVSAAFVHVLGDAIQSVGVMIAAALIWYFDGNKHYLIADPICTFVFSLLVVLTTYKLSRQALAILMEGTPTDIDLGEVEDSLCKLRGVVSIHDLHVWSLTVGKYNLTAHVVCKDNETAGILKMAQDILHRKYNIVHSTLQMELKDADENLPCYQHHIQAKSMLLTS